MAYVQVDKDLFYFFIFYSPEDLNIEAYDVWRMFKWIRTFFYFFIFYSPEDLNIEAYGVWRMFRWIRTYLF